MYLFRDVDAARAYEAGPELAGLRAAGVARSIVTRLLPLQDSLSRQTFGLGVAPSGPRAEAAEAEVNVARSAAGSS